MVRWLAIGPTPGQAAGEARTPAPEDSSYLKGIVLCVGLTDTRESALAIGEFGLACLRKIPNIGAVSQKWDSPACKRWARWRTRKRSTQLTKLRTKVKNSVARRLIEKSLSMVAERAGMTVDELEDVSIPQYPLDVNGALEVKVRRLQKATVRLIEDGRVVVLWGKRGRLKRIKAVPAHARRSRAKESSRDRGFGERPRAIVCGAARAGWKASFLGTRRIPLTHWRRYYIDHPLLGFLGRKLIWVFSNNQGWERSGLWSDGELRDSSNKLVDLIRAEKVQLWHPLSYSAA